MRFQPKTEEEVNSFSLIPDGDYDFTIAQAFDKQSKGGNDMIELNVRVHHDAGSSLVRDYLLESVAYKLRHCAYACGLGAKYEKGELQADDFINRSGRCKVVIRKGRAKEDGSGNWPDKNEIKDYIAEEESDPIPF